MRDENMKNRASWLLLGLPALALAACSGSNPSSASTSGATPEAGGEIDAGAKADGPSGGSECTTARDQLLLPIARVSTAEVMVLGESNGTRTLYVDASAGGQGNAAKNPRVYLDLASGAKVSITDAAAPASTEWDLALKRTIIFTHGGDAGVGQGGAIQLNRPFASVTVDAATAAVSSVERETFFDEECNPKLDPVGGPLTTFSDWYAYDQATNIPTPKDVTYVVRGAQGKTYKVGIKAYDGLPDGGGRNNQSTGFYILQVTAL
jgi:hypothetical protein